VVEFGEGLWSNLVYESQPDGGDEGGGVEFHSDCCYGEFWVTSGRSCIAEVSRYQQLVVKVVLVS